MGAEQPHVRLVPSTRLSIPISLLDLPPRQRPDCSRQRSVCVCSGSVGVMYGGACLRTHPPLRPSRMRIGQTRARLCAPVPRRGGGAEETRARADPLPSQKKCSLSRGRTRRESAQATGDADDHDVDVALSDGSAQRHTGAVEKYTRRRGARRGWGRREDREEGAHAPGPPPFLPAHTQN